MTHMSHRLRVVAALTAALSFSLVGAPAIAQAETAEELQQRLDLARATLDQLGTQMMNASETLYETEYALNQTNQQIEATQAEVQNKEQVLVQTKETLAKRVKAAYKAGQTSPLAAFLEDGGLERLAAFPYYANKMAEQDAQTIQEVCDAKLALEDQGRQLEDLRAEQEQLVEKQRLQVSVLQTAQSAQTAYVDSLDQALRDRLNAEAERELLEQRAAAGDVQAQLELEAARERDAQEAESLQAPVLNLPASAADINIADITGDAVSSMSSATRLTILGAAFSQLGVPYVYGGEQPGVGLDCSGFTQYCYRQAGIELPHSAAAQAAMSRASSIENLQPGDLVFWIGTSSGSLSGNHVAMYIGNGNIIHAVWSGVKIAPLYSGYTKFGVII